MVQGKTIKQLIDNLLHPISWFKERQKFKKRVEEISSRDPFIYK